MVQKQKLEVDFSCLTSHCRCEENKPKSLFANTRMQLCGYPEKEGVNTLSRDGKGGIVTKLVKYVGTTNTDVGPLFESSHQG